MSIVRDWFERLSPELREVAIEVVAVQAPTDEQLEEIEELVEDGVLDQLDVDDETREAFEEAVEELVAAYPQHRFLRLHADEELAPELVQFFETGRHATFARARLDGTEYAPFPLFVDFDATGMLINPDFADEEVGETLPWARLAESIDGDPRECPAHLAIDPVSTAVYLMQSSGNPEKLADSLEAFLARLVPTG
ncbi:MAG: hypothetical protein R3B99_29025 [Polyangiales bacterium]|nr:hypothetical protein [Myxococcales bacterium]MCB9604113.1 hypothetical protein [Sandaracinus sp.]